MGYFLIPALISRAYLGLGLQLLGAAEEIVQQIPSVVEPVDFRNQRRVFNALIAQQLTHMCPVLLFGIGVVILVGGTRAGERDGVVSLPEIPVKMMIEELAVVIGMEAENRERQVRIDSY